MSNALLKDDHIFKPWTYADYKAWELKPGERYEIIHGEAYAMSAPGTFHQLWRYCHPQTMPFFSAE